MKESAGKKGEGVRREEKGSGPAGHGNRYLARVPGEAVTGAARTDTFLGERYRRIARRCGSKKAAHPAPLQSAGRHRLPGNSPISGQ